jgi:GR25 family glycosyltransferase involved in LPS biosynthesis
MHAVSDDAKEAGHPKPVANLLGIYVINLDRFPDRWATIQADFADLPWPIERVAALDAASDPDTVLAQRDQSITIPPDGIGYSRLRFRVYLLVQEATINSHLIALRRFLSSDHAFALILEDDAKPVRNAAEEIAMILSSGAEFDILKLEGIRHNCRRLAIIEQRIGASAALVRPLRPSSGSAAYMVSREGARRMLANIGGLFVTTDDYLNNPGLNGCRILHLSPWLIRQSGAPSAMEGPRVASRHKRLRTPWHVALQLKRRAKLRVALWRMTIAGFSRLSLALRRAPW